MNLVKKSFLLFFFSLLVISCGNLRDYTRPSRLHRSVAQELQFSSEKLKNIYRNPLFKKLLQDILFEMDHYDGFDLRSKNIKKVKALLQDFIESEDYESFFSSLDEEWRRFFNIFQQRQVISQSDQDILKSQKLNYEKHTIKDLEKYIENRLGPSIVENIKSDQISISVHAGHPSHIGADFDLSDPILVRIPSIYENWGIKKFIDLQTLSDKRPKVYFNIPPLREYAHHYSKMIGHLVEGKEIRLNLNDRNNLRKTFQREVTALFEKGKIDEQAHISLGYFRILDEFLQGNLKNWNVLSVEDFEVEGELDLRAKKYVLQDARDPNIKTTLFSINSNTTLWGEGSRFLSESILQYNPKSFTFMGSAGLIEGHRGEYYDSSIPKYFSLKNNEIPVENMIYAHRQHAQNDRTLNKRIIWGTRHSHSNSPMEQSDRWLGAQKKQGVGSVDVEVSLMAESIEQYNQNNFAHIHFGVINLITDKPSIHSFEGVDLDNKDKSLKEKGQLRITQTYIDTLSSYENFISNFDEELRNRIIKEFPGLDHRDIKIRNGVGKVDASTKYKLSYYVYNSNFRSPSSKTILIPMGTSRFDKYNYHTDEWWEKYGQAYSRGEKVPLENPRDVDQYLKQHNLSTNPDVIVLDNLSSSSNKIKLKDFLLEEYLKKYSQDGYVYLYRGIAKANEIDIWESGNIPRGVRYWTPDISYAWRYARKRDDLISGLIRKKSPIVQFKVPKEDFTSMVRNNEIILGTELPRSVHRSFSTEKIPRDHLTGLPYLGNNSFGLELEARLRRSGRKKIAQYFSGTVNIKDLKKDRIKKIKSTYRRLAIHNPKKREEFILEMKRRIEVVKREAQIMFAAQEGRDTRVIEALVKKLIGKEREMVHTSRESLEEVAKSLAGGAYVKRGSRSCYDLLEEAI